jgi:ubiquitin-protein ligase
MNIASKRLMRDYIEIKNSKDVKIFASPLVDNLFEWHANICPTEGIYSGLILHFILKFNENYPKEPPKIKLMTGIPHSNIIKYQDDDYYLCMDLISNFFWMQDGTSSEPYSGWSSSYSVKTIMMQLQTFLFDPLIENYDGKTKHTLYELAPEEGGGVRDKSKIKILIDKAFQDSKNFKCTKCGHCHENHFPKIDIKIPERTEFKIRKDLINDNKLIPEVIELFKHRDDKKKIVRKMISSKYGYYMADQGCNCISCSSLRSIDQNLELDFDNFIEKTKLDENTIWKVLNSLGYDDQLNIKEINIIETTNTNQELLNFFDKIDHKYITLPVIEKIFNYLDTDMIIKIGQSVPELKNFTDLPIFNIKREFICFYTRENFESQILGYGINIKYFKKSQQIQSIKVILDLLSQEAHENNFSQSAWNEEFRFWLPIKINNNHVIRSRKIIENTIANIYFARNISNVNYEWDDDWVDGVRLNEAYKHNEFKPKYFLDIISKILSTMIVDMMKDNVHASTKALNGFCQFHYLLKQFIDWYPELIDLADQKIEFFITNYRYVNKNNFHSLGEFIIMLLVSKKYNWNDIKYYFLKESEVRNIRWILKEIPDFEDEKYNLEKLDQDNFDVIDQIFNIVNVGKKLNLFTIYFINELAPVISNDYSFYYGTPSPDVEKKFQEKVKKIKNISNWKEYYHELNVYQPSYRKIFHDYKKALNISKIKKYHYSKKNQDSLFEKTSWRK